MPMKPEEIDPSTLPVAFRGYDRAATDDLLKAGRRRRRRRRPGDEVFGPRHWPIR